MKKIISGIIVLCATLCGHSSYAQSAAFGLAKGLDIQNTVLRSLAAGYVDTINFDKMMSAGLDAMLETLDPYTVFINEKEEEGFELMTTGNYGGVGALIRKRTDGPVIIYEPYPNSPAVKFGLKPGDEIWAIDGKSVIGETSDSATGRMKGTAGTVVNLTVCDGRTKDTTVIALKRERIHIPSIEYAGILRDSIGYIVVDSFTENVAAEFKEAFLGLKAKGISRLVIDLRENGGGIMDEAIKMVGMFVPKGTLAVSSKGRSPMMNKEYLTPEEPLDLEIPILVMVNGSSASASEIFAGAIQDLDRGTIAGKRTFGKGLIQSVLPTPYDGKVKLTTAKYYTPSGRCVQAIDYSHRNSDGSVGYVPDSLRHEFKTLKGRSVWDGGGITPDIESNAPTYSRPVVALVYQGIAGDWSIEYFKKHGSIAPAEEFHLSDADYAEFVEYAAKQEFDSRSAVEVELDNIEKAAKQDGMLERYKADIEAFKSKVSVDKKTMLLQQKEEILPVLESNIVIKYYFISSSHIIQTRTDSQLSNALDKWN